MTNTYDLKTPGGVITFKCPNAWPSSDKQKSAGILVTFMLDIHVGALHLATLRSVQICKAKESGRNYLRFMTDTYTKDGEPVYVESCSLLPRYEDREVRAELVKQIATIVKGALAMKAEEAAKPKAEPKPEPTKAPATEPTPEDVAF